MHVCVADGKLRPYPALLCSGSPYCTDNDEDMMKELKEVIGILREWRQADHALRHSHFATHEEMEAAQRRLAAATDAIRDWSQNNT